MQENNMQYRWADGTPQRKYADELDRLIPCHTTEITSLWISLAEEVSEETSFEKEAALLVDAFRTISARFKPSTVQSIYNSILEPGEALLSCEIPPAAEDLENGKNLDTVCELAKLGYYAGAPVCSTSHVADPS